MGCGRRLRSIAVSDRAGIKRLICPRCHRRTDRKWIDERVPNGYGWCRTCVPAVVVVPYDAAQAIRHRARAKAQILP